MLQNQAYQEQIGEDLGQGFTPAYIYEIIKRRALYFILPFLAVLAIGSLITLAWPGRYISEGKILVQSQEIPSELVRPTVTSLANERIQVIEQRIMTRDNLMTIAKKYQISQRSWQGALLSGTDLVDFLKARTRIKPLELTLPTERKQAIAFSVGFEYEQPQIAMRVANELVTMILTEDARARTSFASETTKFLERDVQRLEAQLNVLDSQVAELKRRPGSLLTDFSSSPSDESKGLSALKAELVLKNAIYSDSHPDVRALKKRIEALEKSLSEPVKLDDTKASDKTKTGETGTAAGGSAGPTIGLDLLESKRIGLRKELDTATQKLSAARLGESLVRGQQSERLEVLEQPTVPDKPSSPNRPKLFLIVLAAAFMAGGGLAFGAEMLDQSVRRGSDLFSIIDSHLVVSIPYITTHAEEHAKKRKMIISLGVLAGVILVLLIVVIFVLPPLDIVFAKIMTLLLR